MKKKIITQLGLLLYFPIKKHAIFFLFIYLLNAICILYTAERNYLPFFIKLYFELFLDLYILTVLLLLVPHKISSCLFGILGIVFYVISIVDIFCYTRFSSPISASIIRLIAETNTNEATEFLNAYISADIIWSPVGLVFLLATLNVLYIIIFERPIIAIPNLHAIGLFIFPILLIGVVSAVKNKYYLFQTWQLDTVGKIERYMGDNYYASRAQYLPAYRLAFALHANRLATNESHHLIDISSQIEIQHCSFTSPTLVLIIGESYNKHHSQLYGYPLSTTPRQVQRNAIGELFAFQDAVTPFNITSEVLKNAFSLNDLSQHEYWSDKPLFTQLFKKAGYHVTFLSNFFVMKEQKDFADFSGGMFLNNANLSSTQFDYRNTHTHRYDEELLEDYENSNSWLPTAEKSTDSIPHRLIIFSLLGQHVDYKDRYPARHNHFKQSDYQRADLTPEQLKTVVEYDNATLYNDYIVDLIIRLFEQDNALVIYMADHGEEVYDEIKTFGRQHNKNISKDMAKNEFQIPFWIWASKVYRELHPELIAQIKTAITYPFYSDDLSQVMLYLAGIESKEYRDSLNILSKAYQPLRKRLLRGNTDYENIIKNEEENSAYQHSTHSSTAQCNNMAAYTH